MAADATGLPGRERVENIGAEQLPHMRALPGIDGHRNLMSVL
jgi:hypothetical protein